MSQNRNQEDPEPVDLYLDLEPTDCPECGNELDEDGSCQDSDCPESPYYIEQEDCEDCGEELDNGVCGNSDCEESPTFVEPDPDDESGNPIPISAFPPAAFNRL